MYKSSAIFELIFENLFNCHEKRKVAKLLIEYKTGVSFFLQHLLKIFFAPINIDKYLASEGSRQI